MIEYCNTNTTKIYTFSTACALRRKHTVIIIDAVYLIVRIDGERDAVQTFIAHATTEATGMIRLAHRL